MSTPANDDTADNDMADNDLAAIVDLVGSRPHLVEASADQDAADNLLEDLAPALPSPSLAIRLMIVIVGAATLLVAVPWLLSSDPFDLLDGSSEAHIVRDGAFGVIVATSGMLAAWRPRWSLPCTVTALVATIAQFGAGIFDDSIAEAGGSELVHVPVIVLTFLLAISAIRLAPLGPPSRRP